jgi:hypothetical protein
MDRPSTAPSAPRTPATQLHRVSVWPGLTETRASAGGGLVFGALETLDCAVLVL